MSDEKICQELLIRLNACQSSLDCLEKFSDAWFAMSRAIDSIINQLATKCEFDAVFSPITNKWF